MGNSGGSSVAAVFATTAGANGHMLVSGSDTLTAADVAWFARVPLDMQVRVDRGAAERTEASVAGRDRLFATNRPLYGVTTGLGDSGQFHIGPSKTADLQRNLVAHHLNGTGPTASEDTVRATMPITANCLSRGYSISVPQRHCDSIHLNLLLFSEQSG
jgi:histidine ammonia-lyase/phenylalanine ammonia-lyase